LSVEVDDHGGFARVGHHLIALQVVLRGLLYRAFGRRGIAEIGMAYGCRGQGKNV
jgi:hypothetical protein